METYYELADQFYVLQGGEIPTGATVFATLEAFEAAKALATPAPPDPKAFKVDLMAHPLFLEWQEALPATRREDLKMSAIMDNWPLVQALYTQLAAAVPLPTGAAAQWQALADAHTIPLEF